MNPKIKQGLSIALAAAIGAGVTAAAHALVPLAPAYVQPIIMSAVTGVAHWLATWGTAEQELVVK